jgi:Tfp pilus assembly protein PilV
MDLRAQRGTTLLEAMMAMVIVLIAGVGTISVHVQQLKMNAEARRMTEAVALARDLVENIASWPYDETDANALSNAAPGNDADIADDAHAFETDSSPPADHDEADLAALTTAGRWHGLPARDGFERYWNVAYSDDLDENGTWDAARIAVIVRWRSDVGWRRVALTTSKINPREVQ